MIFTAIDASSTSTNTPLLLKNLAPNTQNIQPSQDLTHVFPPPLLLTHPSPRQLIELKIYLDSDAESVSSLSSNSNSNP